MLNRSKGEPPIEPHIFDNQYPLNHDIGDIAQLKQIADQPTIVTNSLLNF